MTIDEVRGRQLDTTRLKSRSSNARADIDSICPTDNTSLIILASKDGTGRPAVDAMSNEILQGGKPGIILPNHIGSCNHLPSYLSNYRQSCGQHSVDYIAPGSTPMLRFLEERSHRYGIVFVRPDAKDYPTCDGSAEAEEAKALIAGTDAQSETIQQQEMALGHNFSGDGFEEDLMHVGAGIMES